MRKNSILISVGLWLAFSILSANLSLAQMRYDIKQMTPEVEAALNGRRERFDQLRQYKASGTIGENNRGYVELLKDDSTANALVDSENRDRKVVYQTIASQNNLTGALETIEKVFAQVQREKALAGESIQTEGGQWVNK